MPAAAGAIVTAGIGVYQLVKGAKDEKKAKRALSRLNKPLYGNQSEYFQNRNILAGEAGQGLSSQTKDYLTSEVQRGLGTGISALTQTGGGINDISKLMDVYNRSMSKIGAEDAETHLKNIQYFMGANKDLAGQKNMQWSINEYQPYQAQLKELTKRREAAEQNMWGGLQTAAGAAMAYGTGSSNQDLMSKLFDNKTDPHAYGAGSEYMGSTRQPAIMGPVDTGTGGINTTLALP